MSEENYSKNVLLKNNVSTFVRTSGITAKLLNEAFLLGLAEIGRVRRLVEVEVELEVELEVETPFKMFSWSDGDRHN